jgi:hypothetical protein
MSRRCDFLAIVASHAPAGAAFRSRFAALAARFAALCNLRRLATMRLRFPSDIIVIEPFSVKACAMATV